MKIAEIYTNFCDIRGVVLLSRITSDDSRIICIKKFQVNPFEGINKINPPHLSSSRKKKKYNP